MSTSTTASLTDSRVTSTTPPTTQRSSPHLEQPPNSTVQKDDKEEQAKASQDMPLTVPQGLLNDNSSCFFNAAIQCIKDPLMEKYAPMSSFIMKEGIEDCVSPTSLKAALKGKRTRDSENVRAKLQSAMAATIGPDMQVIISMCLPFR